MITTNFAEIFAGDVPRINSVFIFLDQVHRSGLSGSMSGASQVSGNHLVGFNLNREYLDNSVKKQFFDDLVSHFSIENPILITRRGGSFAIEQGVVPEWFRVTFPLEFRPSFREADLPRDNEEVMKEVNHIKEVQSRLDRRFGGFSAYAMCINMWWRTYELGKILESLEQPVS